MLLIIIAVEAAPIRDEFIGAYGIDNRACVLPDDTTKQCDFRNGSKGFTNWIERIF
jgi:hypothetical protein